MKFARTRVALIAALLLSLLVNSVAFAKNNDKREKDVRVYEITVTNMTTGQWFTPPVLAIHKRAADLFEVGQPASLGVREIAENGNLQPMVDALTGNKKVTAFTVAAGNPPPLGPGQSISAQLMTGKGGHRLSMVAMLICTNDGFTGIDSVKLPKWRGESVSFYGDGYDAGSEINTEDFADIVPPCPALTGVSSSDPGTGMSNPALAENGVVTMHPGVIGGNDLLPAVHNWSNPVVKVTITRIDNNWESDRSWGDED